MTEEQSYYEQMYMNSMQLRANMIDPNVLIVEVARAGGKTEGVMGPRIIRVSNSLPGELSFLVHKTYVALMTNVFPNIQSYFSRPYTHNGVTRPMLEYGVDYIVGEAKIPSHFRRPLYPIAYPKHSVLFRNGHHLQMVSSDQPESVAGRSATHAFIEEMKHNRGQKLKSRLFPSLRGSGVEARKSPYIYGITGVSDTARVDLGEDNWFEEYENNVDVDLVDDIANTAVYLNSALVNIHKWTAMLSQEKNPILLEKLRLAIEKAQHRVALWQPRIADMRRNCSYYMRASSFVNKDILGPKFFRTQLETLDTDEFLTAICAVRKKEVVNKFFITYNPKVHEYSDSYIYDSILKLDLKDKFILTARYLKYYQKQQPLLLGYDPGHFSSLVCAQEDKDTNTLRVIKNFTCYYPYEQAELAQAFNQFFGADAHDRSILLYHDRAANKKKEDQAKISSDARILKRELEEYGFKVQLMNENQATVYHWQQFKVCTHLFNERDRGVPRVRIDENECKDLCRSIPISPLKKTDGRIELDKESETKVLLQYQADRTTQLPSALIYLLFGRYGYMFGNELNDIPDNLPPNLSI